CGRRPFPGDDPVAVAAAQSEGASDVVTVEPAVPRALGDVIARALAVDVRERYQSAAALEAALDGVLTRRPDQAETPETVGYVVRAAAAIALLPVALAFLGFLCSTAFNVTIGRTGPHARFNHESWSDYLYWGAHSMIAPTVLLIGGAALVIMLSFFIRML